MFGRLRIKYVGRFDIPKIPLLSRSTVRVRVALRDPPSTRPQKLRTDHPHVEDLAKPIGDTLKSALH